MSTQTIPTFHPSSDAAHRLAYLLKAIEDEQQNFSELCTTHIDTMKRLEGLVRKVTQEILTGQTSLLDVMAQAEEGEA